MAVVDEELRLADAELAETAATPQRDIDNRIKVAKARGELAALEERVGVALHAASAGCSVCGTRKGGGVCVGVGGTQCGRGMRTWFNLNAFSSEVVVAGATVVVGATVVTFVFGVLCLHNSKVCSLKL